MGRVRLAMGFLLVLAIFLAGCGGAGVTGPIKTLTIDSQADLDGTVFYGQSTLGNYSGMDMTELVAGSQYSSVTGWPNPDPIFETRSHHRILLSFDLAALTGATIQSAELRLYLDQVVGNPFTVCGPIMLDHVYYRADLTSPDALYHDYVVDPAVSGSIDAAAEDAWASVDVAAAVQADVIAGRGSSRTELTGSFTSKQLSYWSSGGSGTNPPELVVTYTK